jgi:hypothetical protein
LRSFENEEYLESDTHQPGFLLMTRMKVKKEEILSMSLIVLCQSVHSLLVWVGQREFKDTDITAIRKIGTAVRRSL